MRGRMARRASVPRATVLRATVLRAAIFAAACSIGAPTLPAVATTSWAQSPSSTLRADHRDWDAVLRRHVRDGRVDYDGVARDSAFARYLAWLPTVAVDALDEDDRLAYWINAYNAWTVQLIVSSGERETIRNLHKTLGVFRLKGPWSVPLVQAAGKIWTLDEVEHRILRTQFREPRIHFAIVPAARGAAPLRGEAYQGATLDEQLTDQARVFLADTTRNRYKGRVLWLSPVILQYRSDFGANNAELGKYFAPYFPAARDMLEKGRFSLGATSFDWRLNGLADPAGTKVSGKAM
jgi:hypothetical protein